MIRIFIVAYTAIFLYLIESKRIYTLTNENFVGFAIKIN